MKLNYASATIVAAALVISHADRAEADAFVGGLIGGIIGGAVGSNIRTQPRQRATRAVQPRRATNVNTAQRQQNREVQTALNHFGFNVGTADGVLGPRSRAGISQYQGYLGYPTTGQLTDFERNILTTAHQRATMGGPQVSRVVSSHRDGMRGLLAVVRDEFSGGRTAQSGLGAYGLPPTVADAVDEIAASADPTAEQLVQRSGFIQLADLNGDGRTDFILDTSVTGSAFWCNAQSCSVMVFVSTPDGYVRNDFQAFNVTPAMFSCTRGTCSLDRGATATVTAAAPAEPATAQEGGATPVPTAQPVVQTPEPAAPALPSFMGQSQAAQVSLASHCNRVALVTNSNGGFATADRIDDPVFAMNEQFCLARTFAIADGEAIIAQIPGATPQVVAQQCASLAPLLQQHIAALSLEPRADVVRRVASFVLESGLTPEDLGATARVCLASGYLTDELQVALGSSLLLVALGESSYGELPGHHLLQGIGASQREGLAVDWLRASVPADPAHASAATFAPGPGSRNGVIHAALDMIGGVETPAAATPVPVFSLQPKSD
jgi:peptidoglycan hydrolase-like protein with peptidoglycan-binding domain